MSKQLDQFEDNLRQARLVLGHAQLLNAARDKHVGDDLIRASLVAGVSALDYYIHEIVREKMIQIAEGKRSETKTFLSFHTSAGITMEAIRGKPARQWMDEAVRLQHGHISFQRPDKIARAIRRVWAGELWPTVAGALGTNAASVKRSLNLIVSRRNQVVHEADRDPTPPHDRWPISHDDASQTLATIERIVSAIDQIL